ncbi:hypothetical protein FRB96_001976 [Tulasnella sp. 330]|nr:hypothetical protein FRB96_001976 [Tulasnella sp. 330]
MTLLSPLAQQPRWAVIVKDDQPHGPKRHLTSPKDTELSMKGSPFVYMIKECIIAKSWLVDGVSRQVLKTWIAETYGMKNDAVLAKHISLALKTAMQKGVFEFPKGLNGKVKLARPTKPAEAAAKENPRLILADKANLLHHRSPHKCNHLDVKTTLVKYEVADITVKREERNAQDPFERALKKDLGGDVKQEVKEESKSVLWKAAKDASTPRRSHLKPFIGDKENIKPVLIKGATHNIMRHSPLKPSPPIHYRDPLPPLQKKIPGLARAAPPTAEAVLPSQAPPRVHSPIRHAKGPTPAKKAYKPAAKTISKMHLRKIVPAPVKMPLYPGITVKVMGGSEYMLQRRLGSGSFGDVWSGTRWSTSRQKYITLAIKVEFKDTCDSLLSVEGTVYKAIKGMAGVPSLEFQAEAHGYRFLGMTMLGGSFEDELRREKYRMNIKTVINFATQMLTRLEHLHDRGYLHRDLKPENILLHERTCWLVDFGFAKRYCHPKTQEHIAARNGKGALGTPRYASLNVHAGRESARRDDLESLSYILVYLINGRLPWQGLAEKGDSVWDEVYKVKRATPIAEFCGFAQAEFREFSTDIHIHSAHRLMATLILSNLALLTAARNAIRTTRKASIVVRPRPRRDSSLKGLSLGPPSVLGTMDTIPATGGGFHNPHPPKEPGLNARGRRKIRRAMERAARGEVLPDPPSIDGDHDNVATRDSAISNRASGPEQQTYEVSRFDWSPTSSAADGAVSPQSLDPTALAFMPTTPPRHRQSSIISTKSTTPLSIHASPFTPKNSSSSLSTSTHSRNCSNASTTLTALTMATTVEEERDELEKLHIQDPTTISNWQPLGRKPSLDSVKHHYAMKAWLKAKTTREENETTTIYTGPGQVHYIARPESVHYQRHRLALPTLPLYSSLYVSQSDKEVFTLNDETPRAASFSAEEDVEPAVAPNGFHQSPTKIALCAEVVPGTTNPWSLTREEWDQRPNTVYPEGKQFCYEDDTEREASALLRGLGLYGYGYIPTLSPMGGQ